MTAGAPTTPNGRAGRSSGATPTSACNGWPRDFDREAADEPERRGRAASFEDADEARRARRRTFGETGEGLLEESDRSRTRSPSGSRVSGASSDDDALLRWDRGGRRDAPKARCLRDLAAALLRQDGALVAMAAASLPGASTPLAKVAKSSPKGSSRPPVGSFLDETVELGTPAAAAPEDPTPPAHSFMQRAEYTKGTAKGSAKGSTAAHRSRKGDESDGGEAKEMELQNELEEKQHRREMEEMQEMAELNKVKDAAAAEQQRMRTESGAASMRAPKEPETT